MPTKTADTPAMSESDGRRRNRRGEETRRLLIESSVDCLARLGYAATSVEAVMAASGVSRGSVLNLFPSRLALMTATIDAAMQAMVADTQARLAGIEDPVRRFYAICDLFWESQNIPESAAVTEVLLAARWDPDLARELRPIAEQVEIGIDRQVSEIAVEAGATDIDACLIHARILILTLRGITIELMYDPDREIIHRALDRIRAEHKAHCDEMLGLV